MFIWEDIWHIIYVQEDCHGPGLLTLFPFHLALGGNEAGLSVLGWGNGFPAATHLEVPRGL